MQMDITAAKVEQIAMVENLARFYIYDMSEFMGWRCPETGLFGGCDEFFDDWRQGSNLPFLFRVGGELAGFGGVKAVTVDGAPGHCIQEFFILRKFRRRGLGRDAAQDLFRRFPGPWLVEQLAQNTAAQAFWRTIAAESARGPLQIAEHTHPAWGKMLSLRFTNG